MHGHSGDDNTFAHVFNIEGQFITCTCWCMFRLAQTRVPVKKKAQRSPKPEGDVGVALLNLGVAEVQLRESRLERLLKNSRSTSSVFLRTYYPTNHSLERKKRAKRYMYMYMYMYMPANLFTLQSETLSDHTCTLYISYMYMHVHSCKGTHVNFPGAF